MIDTGIIDYNGMTNEKLRSIAQSRYCEYIKQYRYYEESILRPWRRIHLYKTLVHIYGLVMTGSYDRDKQITFYNFKKELKSNIEYINNIRKDNYNLFEKLDKELNYFGYDRDTNRERIMYKQIYQECDELLKIIQHLEL